MAIATRVTLTIDRLQSCKPRGCTTTINAGQQVVCEERLVNTKKVYTTVVARSSAARACSRQAVTAVPNLQRSGTRVSCEAYLSTFALPPSASASSAIKIILQSLRHRGAMIYDTNSLLFRSFLTSGGASSSAPAPK